MDFLNIRGLTPAIARSHFRDLIKMHQGISNRCSDLAARIRIGGNNPRRVDELEQEMIQHGAYARFLQGIGRVIDGNSLKPLTLKKANSPAAGERKIGNPQRLRAGKK